MKNTLGLLVVLACVAGPVSAQEVRAARGNIEFVPAGGGQIRTLTNVGLDAQPELSNDRQWVTFVRTVPGRTVETALGPHDGTELWIIRADGTGARRIVADGQVPQGASAIFLNALEHPRFSPDGETIYVESDAAVTTRAISAVNVATGETRFVCNGALIELVEKGELRGDLIVVQHRYFLAGGSYDWLWLVSPTGEALDPIGTADNAEGALRALRQMYEK